MNHSEKLACALRDLRKVGVGRYSSGPPLYRLLWWAGFELPPPYFCTFRQLFGLVGASLFLSLSVALRLSQPEMPMRPIIVISLIVALPAAAAAAGVTRLVAKRKRIPLWENYRPKATKHAA